MKPARQGVTRRPHRSVGFVADAGLGSALVEHESFLEKSFVVVATVCGFIEGLESQPFTMAWHDSDGKERSYTPDFRVTLRDGTQSIVEIKPSRFMDQNVPRFDAVAPLLKRNGLPFFVLTDEHLQKRQAELAQLCRRYKHTPLPEADARQALELAGVGVTWAEAQHSSVPLFVWYGLLGRGELGLERLTDMTDASARLLTSQELEKHDCCLRFSRWFGCSPWKSHA